MAERDYYKPVKSKLEELLKGKTNKFYLEITAEKKIISEILKSRIPQGKEIIFHFLKEFRPDVTGYITNKYGTDSFIVVEVKEPALKLNDIYQLRRYADQFEAALAFLISVQPIPEELKRLVTSLPHVCSLSNWSSKLAIVRLDSKSMAFIEWFPVNPFEKDFNWEYYNET